MWFSRAYPGAWKFPPEACPGHPRTSNILSGDGTGLTQSLNPAHILAQTTRAAASCAKAGNVLWLQLASAQSMTPHGSIPRSGPHTNLSKSHRVAHVHPSDPQTGSPLVHTHVDGGHLSFCAIKNKSVEAKFAGSLRYCRLFVALSEVRRCDRRPIASGV